MKTNLLIICIIVLSLVILIPHAFAEKEILILVENEVWKVYYTGENIISVLADPESASVIFETGKNAKLDVKAPKVYKVGPNLFTLRNGEEVEAVKDMDECFYYATFETQEPEKIEIAFTAWPEYKELVENCETFKVSPRKQIQLGVYGKDIQCYDDRVLVLKKSRELYSCIKPETVPKLFARNWALNEVEIINTYTAEQESKLIKITGIVNRLTTPEGFEYHLIPLTQELPRIEYTGYDTLNLFATNDTIHHFLRELDGKLVTVEGNLLLENGKYFRHFSGFPTIPVTKLDVVFDKEDLKYHIEKAKLVSVTKIPETNGINIVLQEAQNGIIVITIPRDLIDTKIGQDDDSFIVLIDGYEVPYTEDTNDFERTLTIKFEEGARIIQVMTTVPI